MDWTCHKETCDKIFIIKYCGKIEDTKGHKSTFEFEETMGKREKRELLKNEDNITNFMEEFRTSIMMKSSGQVS
jgi:hypothetical protein